MKRNFSIKIRIIAAVLIAAFFAQDIVWANPDMLENRQSASTLQIPNFSQNVSLETVLETTLRRLSAYEYSPPTPTRLVIHDKGVQMELVLPPDADGNISCSTIANGSRQHFTARVLQDRSIQLLPVKDGAIPQRDTLLSEVAPDAAVNVSPANIQSANIQFANILPANVPLADIPLANAPENTPPSRKKLHLAAVVISVLALGISMTMPSQLSGYLTFPIYYTLLGLIGNYLASRMDGDRKWGRFAVAGALMFIVSSSYFPWYMNFTQTHIIDYGLWSHSLRPLMDIFIWSQPWHIISICAQGLRQRGEDISAGKGLFARLWSKESRTYLKEKVRLYYGRDGLLKTIILFWFPLIHFMYYSLTPVEYLQVSALIGPIWTVVSAVYYVQRPGHDLTPNPIVNKILKHVYFIPIISVVATTVIAGLSGNASLTLDCLSCILTTSVGYAAFRLLAWPVNYLFDRSPGSAAKTTSAAYARVGPDANTDGVLGISESVLNSPKTRWYDRTALIGLGGGDVLACKFLKEGEDAAVLEDEARAMKRLLDEGVYAPVPVGPEMGSYLFSYEGALLAAAPETAFHASRLYTAYVMNIKYYLRNSGDTTLNPSGDPDNSNRVSALGEPADDPFGGRSIASVSATPEKPARKSDGSHRVFKDTPLKFADGFTDQQREWIGSINNIVPPFHASGLKNIEKETQFKLEGHYDDGKIWLQSNMHEKKKFSETYAHELGHHVEELYMSDESTKAFYFLGWKNAAFPVRRVVAFIVAAPILAAWAIVKAGLAYDILMPAAVVLISVPIVIIFLRFGIGMADLGRPISMTVWLRTHWSILNYVSLYALQSQRDFFAETYMHYICFPELFRKKAGKNEEIKKQYEFMRARIFNGVEYFTDENTGDPRQIKRNMPAIATVRKPEGSPAVCLGAIITYCAGDLNKSFSAEELIDAGLRSHLVKKEGVSRDFAVSTVKLELRLLRQVGILDAMPGTRTSRYMLKPAIRDLSLSAAQDLVSSIQEISEFNHYDMPRDIRRMMRILRNSGGTILKSPADLASVAAPAETAPAIVPVEGAGRLLKWKRLPFHRTIFIVIPLAIIFMLYLPPVNRLAVIFSYPLSKEILTTAVLSLMADCIAQKLEGRLAAPRHTKFNYRRLALFMIFESVIYGLGFALWLGLLDMFLSNTTQAGIMRIVLTATVYTSLYYLFYLPYITVFAKASIRGVFSLQAIRDSIAAIKARFFGLYVKDLFLYTLIMHPFNFLILPHLLVYLGVNPSHLNNLIILEGNLVALFWSIYVSMVGNRANVNSANSGDTTLNSAIDPISAAPQPDDSQPDDSSQVRIDRIDEPSRVSLSRMAPETLARKVEGSPAVCLGAIITYCAGDLNKSFSAEELIDAGLRSHLVKKEGVSRDFAVSTVKLELRLLRQVGLLDAMPGTRTSRYMLKPAIRDLSLSAAQDLVSSIQEISEFNHYDMPRDIRRMMRMVVRVVIHNASQEKVGLGLGFDITKAGIGRLLWTLSCFACYVKGKRREDKSGGENYKIKVSEIQDEIKKHPGALKALVEEILKRSGPGPEINIDDIPEEILVETIIDNGVYESIIQMGLAYAKGLPAHEVMDISVLHPGDTVHIVGEDEPRMVSTVSSADNELACDELVSVSSTDFSFNENKKIELILEPSAPKKSDSSSAACLEGIMKYCGDNLAREFTIVDLMRAKLMLRFVKSSGKEKIFARSGVKNKLKFLYDIDVLDIIPGPWFRRYRLKSDIRDLPLPAARQLVSRIQNIPTLTYHYVPKEGCSITRDTVRDLYKEAARKPRNSWNSGNTTLNSAIDPISAAPQPDDSQPDDSSAIKIGGSALGGNQVRIDRIDEPSRVSLSGMALETPTRRVEGSPAVCLEAIIKYCGGDLSKSFSAYELIAGGFRSRAVKEYGASKDFALSTVKFELRLLRQVGVLDVVSGSRTYRYILKSDIRDLSPPELQALIVSIQNISALNHYDMSDSLRRKTRSSVRALIREPLVRRNDALAERTIIMESGAGDTFTGAVLSAHNGEFYILSAGHNFEKIDDVHGYIRVTRSGEEKVVRLDGRVVKFKNDGRGRDFSLLKLRGPADIEFEPLTIGDPPVSDGFSAYIPFIDIDKITDLAVANGYLYKVFLPAKRYAQSPGEDVNQLYIYTDTSALKQHGVSGSPVYKDGKLVGMVCFMDIEAEGACAVTGNAIRAFLETTEYAAAISDPGKFLRNIVDTKELTQNMIEGILSQLFSNKKLTLAFSRKLSGLQSKQLGALLKQLNKWKESTARGNAKMKSLLDNFTILEYDDLKAELDRRGIDARAKDAVILTYAPKPEDGSSDTSSLGGAVRPVYIIEETGAFPADFYYPLLEMVTVSLAKELLRWNKVELKEALIASNITTDNFGIDAAMDERSGALVFRVLPRMKRYNNSDRVDRYTRLIQFLRAA